jgi:hypothetical protein
MPFHTKQRVIISANVKFYVADVSRADDLVGIIADKKLLSFE